MAAKFRFDTQGTNPSPIAMIIGIFTIFIGFGAYTFGIEEGWNLVILGVVFFFTGVLLNVAWMQKRSR